MRRFATLVYGIYPQPLVKAARDAVPQLPAKPDTSARDAIKDWLTTTPAAPSWGDDPAYSETSRSSCIPGLRASVAGWRRRV